MTITATPEPLVVGDVVSAKVTERNHGIAMAKTSGGQVVAIPISEDLEEPSTAMRRAGSDAFATADMITASPGWSYSWVLGHNDNGLALYDPSTGSTDDGPMQDSINENRGAESTIAGTSTPRVAALCADEGRWPSSP